MRGTLGAVLRCSSMTVPPSVPKLVQGPTKQLHKTKGRLLGHLGPLLPAPLTIPSLSRAPLRGDSLPEQERE